MPREKPLAFVSEMQELSGWAGQARCQNYNPGLWDTRNVSHQTYVTPENERAIEICLNCPVMMDCLEHAAEYDIRHGIWGGMTVEERDEWAAREGLKAA